MANLTFRFNTKTDKSRVDDYHRSIKGLTNTYGKYYNQNKKVNNAIGNMTKDGNRATGSFSSMTKAFRSFNSVLGIGRFSAFAYGVKSCVQASMDGVETQNLFQVALGQTAEETDNVVSELSRLSGLDITNLRSAVGTYALLARSMGMNAEQTKTLSVNTAKLATDLSSLTNVSIEQVMADLKSGLVGQSETVYKYGMDVTEAGIKQEALAQGITKSVRNMSQGEKMALRYSVMIKNSSLAHGDFAKTIETPANQLRILKERIYTLTKSIGNAFIPILTKVLPYINAFVLALTRMANKLATLFGYKESKVENQTGLGSVKDDADNVSDSIDGATASAKKFKRELAGFDEINTLGSSDADTGGSGSGVGGASILDTMDLGEYDNLFDKIEDTTDLLADEMQPILEEIFNLVVDIGVAFGSWKLAGFLGGLGAGGALGKLSKWSTWIGIIFGTAGGQNLGVIIGDKIITWITEFLEKHMPKRLFEALDGAVAGALGGVVAGSWLPVIGQVVGAIVGALVGGLMGAFGDKIGEFWDKVKEVMFNWDMSLEFYEHVEEQFKNAFNADNLFEWALYFIEGIVEGVGYALMAIGEPLVDLYNWVARKLEIAFDMHSPSKKMMPFGANIFLGLIEGIKQKLNSINLMDVGSKLMKKIKDSLANGWSSIKSWWSTLSLPSFHVKSPHISWSQYGSQANGILKKALELLNLPTRMPKLNVSWYAKGGIIDNPSVIGVGEAGAEAVVPLENNTKWIDNIANRINSMTGNSSKAFDSDEIGSIMYSAVYDAVGSAIAKSSDKEVVMKVGSTEFGRVAIKSINTVTKEDGKLSLIV